MEALATFEEFQVGPSLTVRAQAAAHGDVIFLPSDAHGSPGLLNSAILSELGIDMELPKEEELERGYCFRKWAKGLICFVVTVGLLPTERALRTFLSQALRTSQLDAADKIWIPLMGTGAGRLSYQRSFDLIYEALRDSGWLDQSGRQATISIPADIPLDAAKALMAAIEEAQKRATQVRFSEEASKSNVYNLDISPAVDGVLSFAAILSSFRPRSRKISSSLLFFAFAESQRVEAPAALASDGAAELFATAIRDLTGDGYEKAWRSYFGTSERSKAQTSNGPPPRPSKNVAEILQTAAEMAGSEGAPAVNTDHLIEALLNHKEMGLVQVLGQLDFTPDHLFKEYLRARIGQITMKFSNDVASDIDRLGYDGYATAIVDFLTHAETPPPLSISIQAPWGGGKSSLMKLVREKLDPASIREKHKRAKSLPSVGEHLKIGKVIRLLDGADPFTIEPDGERSRMWTIWFNAWKYETSEQIWAGLVDAIVSQVAERLPFLEREKFLLKLQLARIDDGIVRKRIYDRVFNIWWSKVRAGVLASVGALSSLVGFRSASAQIPSSSVQAIGLWAGYSALFVPIVMAIYLVITYFTNRAKVRNEPAKYSLADYIRVPNYEKSVGEIHQIHDDLRRVLSVVPRDAGSSEHAPIVIFIDDLDRCSPGKVAAVVEGVSMLLASDTYRCMFVIGMDPQMVAAALEKAHEDVRKRLPRYERTVPLGWRFMDKFIQLPFTIPPAPAAQFSAYLDWLSDTSRVASSTMQWADPTDPQARVIVQDITSKEEGLPMVPKSSIGTPGPADQIPEISATLAESRDVGAIIRTITKDSVANPREMKRIINLARFYLALRTARRRRENSWRAPSPAQYARWIALTLRWPDMMRWLQWGADEASWGVDIAADNLVVRRLRKLETIAGLVDGLDAWKAALKANLTVPVESESDWGCDPKLFEFFQAEDRLLPQQRLSAAAQREFW